MKACPVRTKAACFVLQEQMNRATLGDQRILALKANYERVLKEMEEERQQLQVSTNKPVFVSSPDFLCRLCK